MYRPEGWNNKYPSQAEDGYEHLTEAYYAYEAGAECDGIIKKIESMPQGTTHCDILRVLRGEDEL